MNREGDLFSRIHDRENLRQAFAKAVKGKRKRPDARAFAARLDENLVLLAEEIRTGKPNVGECRQFTIHDPKRRVITAPCFRERVLHHAIMNLCEPVFERHLIFDTYACRRGFGRFGAIARALEFARRHDHYLKMDIRRYFESIPHSVLEERLTRLFRERRLLELFGRIIRAHEAAPGLGLPIGSLISQHCANFYLAGVDRFIKESLRAPGYVRYMDDSVCWHSDRRKLCAWRDGIGAILEEKLGLQFKATPAIQRSSLGMDFLGARVFPGYATLSKATRRRIRRRLTGLEREFEEGRLAETDLQRRATALFAQTRAAPIKSWRFRRSLLSAPDFNPGFDRPHPRAS